MGATAPVEHARRCGQQGVGLEWAADTRGFVHGLVSCCHHSTFASSSLSLEPALFYRREVFLVLFQAPFAEAQLGSK